MLLGFILGILLTIAGTYVYDSNTGRLANGLSASAAGGQPPLVNDDWQNFQAVVRAEAEDLQKRLK